MKTFRIVICAVAMLAGLVCVPARSGGIPVIDGASMAQDMMNFIREIEQMVKEYEMLKQQFDQMEKEFKSMTGGRGLASAMENPRFRNYLPADWRKAYEAARAGGKGLEMCKGQSSVCEALLTHAELDKGFFDKSYDLAVERTNQIIGLLEAASETEDPKDIAELQARIQGEQALLQNEATKLEIFRQITEREQKMLAQQEHEDWHKAFFGDGSSTLDYDAPEPITDW